MYPTLFTLSVFIAVTAVANSQDNNWLSISPDGVPIASTRDLIYSENLDMTIHLGEFLYPDNSAYLAGFNGADWIVIADTFSGSLPAMVDFQEGILVGGNNAYVATGQMNGIAYYSGGNWAFPWNFNNDIQKLIWANDTLYAIGGFTQIDGQPANRLARLEGNNWVGLINEGVLQTGTSSLFFDFIFFEGKYYVCGEFETISGVKDFAEWVDNELIFVPGAPDNPFNAFSDMIVFNEELYLGGQAFDFDQGGRNLIVKYDGETFSSLSPGLSNNMGSLSNSGFVKRLYEINGYLYAAGFFRYAGNVPVYGLARWDGSSWCSLFMDEFDQPSDPPYINPVIASGLFQNKLMLNTIAFDEDGNPDLLWLYDDGNLVQDCTEPLTISENTSISFQLFPNPAQTRAAIQSSERIISFRLYNSLGVVVKSGRPFSERFEMDLGGLAAGIYLVEVQTEKGVGVEKLVVE